MKCTVQEAKSPVINSSGSVARRDLIPAYYAWYKYEYHTILIYFLTLWPLIYVHPAEIDSSHLVFSVLS
jgi:hypothetical protein